MNFTTRLFVSSFLVVSASSLAAAALPPCGQPTGGTTPRASDALYVLKAAVQATDCDIRVCDASDSNSVTASDALIILKSAVGQSVRLNCPG